MEEPEVARWGQKSYLIYDMLIKVSAYLRKTSSPRVSKSRSVLVVVGYRGSRQGLYQYNGVGWFGSDLNVKRMTTLRFELKTSSVHRMWRMRDNQLHHTALSITECSGT